MAEESFQDNFFDTEYLKADLKGRSVRGGAVTMAGQGAKFFLGMVSTVVLARLLTPQDFGLIAMVAAVTGFVVMFKDMGLSMATVQRAEINHGQISTLFWINVALSLGVMLVIAALAPAIAWFYGEPRLTWITLALAGAFIFGGLTIQHQALLRRNMRFGSLALIQIVSMLVGIVAAIISAWYGAGYWALVIMQLAGAITGAIAVWVACGWRPGLPVRRSGVREMLAFGGNLTGFNIINYFVRNIDKILIGRYLGPTPLGLFSKSYNLLLLPIRQINAPISAVAIPGLSLLQNEKRRYIAYYLKAVSAVSFITMPIMLFLIFNSEKVIRLVLGDQWLGVSQIFGLLGIAALVQPVANTAGWLYVSMGRPDRMLRWRICTCWISPCLYFLGLHYYGLVGVAYAHVSVSLLLFIPALWYAQLGSGIGIQNILTIIVKVIGAALVVNMTVLLLMPEDINIVLSFGLMVFLCLCLLVLTQGIAVVVENFKEFGMLFGRKED